MTHAKYLRPSSWLAFAQILFAIPIWQATAFAAEPFKRPAISYKANFDLSVGSITLSGTTWYTPARERSEMSFGKGKFKGRPTIHRWDKKLLLVLDQTNKTYFTQRLKQQSTQSGLIHHRFSDRTKVSTEIIAGIKTTKYRVRSAGRNDRQLTGYIWVGENNILLRIDGRVTVKGKTRPFKFALKNLAFGPQPAGLFEIPHGYKPARPTLKAMGYKRPRPVSRAPGHNHGVH